MEKDRPFVLPWSSQNQIYGDLSILSRRFPSLLKNQITTKYNDNNSEYKFGLSNKIESYWDRKIFGQLTSKSGDLRNNQGLYKLNILSFSELPNLTLPHDQSICNNISFQVMNWRVLTVMGIQPMYIV